MKRYEIVVQYRPSALLFKWEWVVFDGVRVARWSDGYGCGIAMGDCLSKERAINKAKRAADKCAAYEARTRPAEKLRLTYRAGL